MTRINLIEHRQKKLEQKKNRLKQLEASLNMQARKTRTRKLIELGELVTKANLEEWNTNTLLGALLSLKEKETDQSQMEEWTRKGGSSFEKNTDKDKKSPVVVKFKEEPSDDAKTLLKSSKIKWNRLRKEWEGYANIDELQYLLAPHNATIEELSQYEKS